MNFPEPLEEPRFSLYWPLRAAHPTAGAVYVETTAVGSNGFRFQSPAPYEIGEQVEVTLWIDAYTLISCSVFIAHEEPPAHGRHGYWAEFEAIADSSRQRIASVLEAVRQYEEGDYSVDLAWRRCLP